MLTRLKFRQLTSFSALLPNPISSVSKPPYIPEKSELFNILNEVSSLSSLADRSQRSLGALINLHKYDFEVNVATSRNNTLITFCNRQGLVQFRTSAGTCGLKKAARGSSDAGYQAALQCLQKTAAKGIQNPTVHVKMNGFGPGRDQAFRALITGDWQVRRITDVTPIRFGGCRAKKKRRL